MNGHGCAFRLAVFVVSSIATLAFVPRLVAGRDANRWYDGDLETQDALAENVAQRVMAQPGLHFYHTKSARFDGQSAIAIYQMTILGLGQIVLEHPEKRAEYLPVMKHAAMQMTNENTLAYAESVWGQNGVVSMGPGQGHAYLGYVNLALGMLRAVDPDTPFRAQHDRISAELAERLFASKTGMIETYPTETWPPDVAAVAGSIGLHSKLSGVDRSVQLRTWAERFASCAVDPGSGYLVQRVRSGTCQPLDAPRGSGTAVSAYFISFVDRALSRRLHGALREQGRRTLLGFGGIREYAPGHEGKGDVNAGPILLAVSVGATGFAIGSARSNSDRDLYRELYRTAHLFGVPVSRDHGRGFAVGGALGNALLLAMLTARDALPDPRREAE
jgi:hypothetical protein